jgi:peptide chain release factor 1
VSLRAVRFSMDLTAHIQRFTKRLGEVERELSDPATFSNPARFQELGREHARLKQCVTAGEAYTKTIGELAENREILAAEPAESELATMFRKEIDRLDAEEKRLRLEVQRGILPEDPADSRNTILEIRAAAGGAESALFAADLYRMYSKYAEARGWRIEVLDSSPSDLGGMKEVTLNITGQDVYRRLKYESGPHRVQRVPATEAQGRIHTSTVTVAVLPEAEEVDLVLKPEELEISVCRASGPGGQGVNTTDSAVQILHKPTGAIVRCADGRSQQKNKQRAMTVLRSRLLDHKREEEHDRYSTLRSKQLKGGKRSERIRTYNFPQNRVTDHRVDLTLYNLPAVIDGHMDDLLEPLMAYDIEQRLAELQG